MGPIFQNRVVVITGASAGVGAACARQFAAQGAKLVLAARGLARLQAVVAQCGGPQRALAVAIDVADPAQCEALIAQARAEYGGIDVLVNNAGCNHRGRVADVAPRDLGQIIDVNLRAPILLTRLALPDLQARRGAVVNVASIAGRVPLPHEAGYCASKFGLRAFGLALYEELLGSGVRVATVSPGPIETGFILDEIETVPDTVFSQPMSSAERIAAAVLACARDGRPERVVPAVSGKLATLAYLWPGIFRKLRPLFERRGGHNKLRFIAARSGRRNP